MSLSDTTREKIEELISKDEVVLFMKGTRQFPQCGFSATVTQILTSVVSSYETVNVLSDPEIRSGIKEFSNWPTIPQLYIRGEFVGGCDIVRDLHASGELAKMLGANVEPPEPPQITITDGAAKALREALSDAADGDEIHLAIDPSFDTTMDLAPRQASDIAVETNGITVLIDASSAGRANGLSIDFVDSGGQTGFKIDNPNAPPKVQEISPKELKAKLDAGEIKELFDVRTEKERSVAKIDGTRLLDDAAIAYIESLDRQTPIAFHCHRGQRSLSAAEHFRDQGFRHVYNLTGGIDAWSQEVDAKVPRY